MRKYPIDQLKEFTLGWVEGVRSPGQREIRFDRPLKKIQDAVSGPLSSNAVGQAAASLGVLAAWEGMHGAAAILTGDDTGWARMAISREFLYWNIRVISGMQRAARAFLRLV
ncbi:MAG TPA: hypothetical protein VFE47_13360 [Tepidisphaeraceae bacterium]|jgi:hypothetical protein|nr:hypothetical protein [Tepidisphaeraceae bacterium]